MPISRFASKRLLKKNSPRIAITFGDAAGIGPEVTLKALAALRRNKASQRIVIGKASFFNSLSKKFKIRLFFEDVTEIGQAPMKKTAIPCFYPYTLPSKISYGASQNSWSSHAVGSIRVAVALAMAGKVEAVVTAPINKAGLKKAGFNMLGHTEYLAKLSKTKYFEMMLVGASLRVVLVTRHRPLKEVSRGITKKRVEEALTLTDRELKVSFGIRKPRIVVCGLNPHAGEEGHLGDEEIKKIAPAVRAYRKKTDSTIIGPLSPDALFHDAYQGLYDAEICMYHDQGLIPLKMVSRGSGVNVTLGLPFVRTSPDHGTGYDIAGKGSADAGSMKEAIKLAIFLSQNRRKYGRSREIH